MTHKELKRLSRIDLIEMLLELTQENEQLRQQLQQAEKQIQERDLQISQVGNLAEASMELSGIFQKAQETSELYLKLTQDRCRKLEEEARERCKQIFLEAGIEVAEPDDPVEGDPD